MVRPSRRSHRHRPRRRFAIRLARSGHKSTRTFLVSRTSGSDTSPATLPANAASQSPPLESAKGVETGQIHRGRAEPDAAEESYGRVDATRQSSRPPPSLRTPIATNALPAEAVGQVFAVTRGHFIGRPVSRLLTLVLVGGLSAKNARAEPGAKCVR